MTDEHVSTSPCPYWCEQLQCQEANPADRYHQRMVVVPVVFRGSGGTAEATELVVVIFTSAAARDEVWVVLDLGEGRPNITLSVGSSRRLLRVLERTLPSIYDAL